MQKQKDIMGVLLERFIGFAILLIVWGAVNIVAETYRENTFLQVVDFFNSNIGLIFIISVIFFFGDLLSTLNFPFNFIYPPFNAIGSVFIITFIYQIFSFVENITDVTFTPLKPFMYFLMSLVFFITLIVGYVKIFRAELPEPEVKPKKETKKTKVKTTKSTKTNLEWHDVGEEFKGVVYDIFRKIRESINDKK